MPRLLRQLSFAVCLLGLVAVPARPQDVPAKDGPPKADRKAPEPKETIVETRHTVTLNGQPLSYVAAAGNLLLREEDGKPTASVYFYAYSRTASPDAAPDPSRPIMFCFNGGPGSSSVWLHLGAFGPRRVLMHESGAPLPPPYRLVENDDTLLDLTDLVFIDPVSTGYSRAAPGVDAKRFHGVQEDVQSVGEFIRQYVTRYDRWRSPKYLAGESYGTTRAAGLAAHLQDRLGMNLNGVILISSVLNFQTIRFDDGNDLPYVLFLPTYTATAWYHKKLPPDLQDDFQKAIAESERFAQNEYALALLQGDRLTDAQKQAVAQRLSRLTGLSEQYVREANLRVDNLRFCKELLRDRRRTVGRYDSRLMGTDAEAVGDRPDFDPSYAAVQGPYTATIHPYLRSDLRVMNDLTYEVLTGRVQPWDFGAARNRYLNVAPALRSAMTKNLSLRLFVASGYFDLATPYLAADYTVVHLGLGVDLRDRITAAYYDAGHMMYIYKPAHDKLRRDLAAFLAGERGGASGGQ